MPPDGKIPDEQIALISTWIEEGAKYDGGQATISVKTVAAKVMADSQTHEQLAESRSGLAEKNWELVMTDSPADVVQTENFLIMGTHATISVNLERWLRNVRSLPSFPGIGVSTRSMHTLLF